MERFIFFIYCAIFMSLSNAQRTDVGRLNFKVSRLNRKTDSLQNEVMDLWAAVLTPGFVGRDLGNQTKADNPSIDDSRDCSIMVNETIATAQELKSEVKGLMITARDGLKNEKTWQREMGKNVSEKLQDFQTEMATSNQDVKLQIDTLDRDFNVKLETTYKAQSVINEGVSKIIDELQMRAYELETENQALNHTINDLQSENENMKADNLVLKQTIKDIQMDLKAMELNFRVGRAGRNFKDIVIWL